MCEYVMGVWSGLCVHGCMCTCFVLNASLAHVSGGGG